RFAERDNFWMAAQFAQGVADIVRRAVGVGRMPACDGVDHRMLFREMNCSPAAFEVCADGNNFRDAGGAGAFENLFKIRGEVGIIQVRVRVVKNSHERLRAYNSKDFCSRKWARRLCRPGPGAFASLSISRDNPELP